MRIRFDEERDASASNEIRQLPDEPRPVTRCTEHHERPLCASEHRSGPLDSGFVRDRKFDRMQRDDRQIVADLLARDVLRPFY